MNIVSLNIILLFLVQVAIDLLLTVGSAEPFISLRQYTNGHKY